LPHLVVAVEVTLIMFHKHQVFLVHQVEEDLLAPIQLELELQGKVILVELVDLVLATLVAVVEVLELPELVEQVLPLEVVLEVMDYQHFRETLEFLQHMEQLDQIQEDILQAAAADQKVVMGDLVVEVLELLVGLQQHLELQVLPILVVVEEVEMLLTVLVVLADQESSSSVILHNK
jgi:hypothetical protein